MLKTRFWREAAAALPARYLRDLEQAERWELRLEAAIEYFSRAKAALFHTPRSAH
jgi:hypothetical protein